MASTDSESIISLQDLHVHFGRNHVLKGLSTEILPGATGLLGPNGAGKSTLIRTILGFLKPSSGCAFIFGKDCSSQGPQARQRAGYMPEHEALVPGLTAVGFVMYMGRLCGMPKDEAMQRAHTTLQYVGLGEARYRAVESYSTGMKQRIKLAQALVHDPDLLLLDEPASGLDPKGRREMLELIRDVAFEKGISVLLSSHLLPDVEFACDRVVVLNHGQIATSGSISELKALHQRFFEMRIKGDRSRLEGVLVQRGLRSESLQDGKLRVLLGPDDEPAVLFQAAKDSGVQIRHLAKQELTLQEIFEKAINGDMGQAQETTVSTKTEPDDADLRSKL